VSRGSGQVSAALCAQQGWARCGGKALDSGGLTVCSVGVRVMDPKREQWLRQLTPEQRRQWDEYVDGLRPARGIAYGVLGGLGIWCVIGLLIWWSW
jgi:hypothetical protein